MTDCVICGKPNRADTAWVCHADTRALAKRLQQAAELAPELDVTIARQGRSGQHAGGRSAEKPLPVDLVAADSAWAIQNTLTTWAQHCAETRGIDLPMHRPIVGPVCYATPTIGPACRRRDCRHWTCWAIRDAWDCLHDSCMAIRVQRRTNPLAQAARWLVGQLEWLRHRPESGDAWDELTDACGLLVRTVDRRSDAQWYAGPCGTDGCQADLYARAGASTVRCRGCGTQHDAQERREWLLDQAEDELMPAEALAMAVTALGTRVTGSQVRNWAARHRLWARAEDAHGRPRYRVGDVLDILEEQAQVERERRERKAAKQSRTRNPHRSLEVA